MHFGQFPTFDVQKVPLLLDAFTYPFDLVKIVNKTSDFRRARAKCTGLASPDYEPVPEANPPFVSF